MDDLEQQHRVATASAAIHNNIGVNCLKRGHFSEAQRCLLLALEGLMEGSRSGGACNAPKSPLQNNTNNDKSNINNAESGSEFKYSLFWNQSDNFADFVTSVKIKTVNGCEISRLFLQSHAIYLLSHTSAYIENNAMANTVFISAVILYNLGLVYQIMGSEVRNSDSKHSLTRALTFYTRARLLLRTININLTKASGFIVGDYLVMLVTNNLGSLSYHFELYDEMKECFDNLDEFLQSVLNEFQYQIRSYSLRLTTSDQSTRSHQSFRNNQENKPQLGLNSLNLMERRRLDCLLNIMVLRRPALAAAA